MGHRLVEIKDNEWIKLKDVYMPETPETILALSTINNYIRWKEKNADINNLAIYALDGNYLDGTFAVLDRYHIYFDTLSETNERLIKLLELVDYSNGLRIMHVRSKTYPAILKIIKGKQLQLEYDDVNFLYYLRKEQAMEFDSTLEPINGFYSRSLTSSDVTKANAEWPFNHIGSLYYLQRLAHFNASCGIFTSGGDTMIASGFQLQTGPIGMLHTNPDYRNRSYGTIIVKMICRQIAELGYGVTACVKPVNLPSRTIFEKIGFQIIDKVHWMAIPCNWSEESDVTYQFSE